MPTVEQIRPGKPEPLGATVMPDGINFAVHSAGASRIDLLLFLNIADRKPSKIIQLSPEVNKTGDIWHVFVEGLPNGTLYNYRAEGPYEPSKNGTRFNARKALLDPYAKAITGEFDWLHGDALGYDDTHPDDPDRHLRPSEVGNVRGAARCLAFQSNFDWEGDHHPEIPLEESIIYEVNLRASPGIIRPRASSAARIEVSSRKSLI